MGGIGALTEEPPPSSAPFHRVRTGARRRGLSPARGRAGALILELPVSRTVRKRGPWFTRHPSCGTLFRQPEWPETGPIFQRGKLSLRAVKG